MGYAFLRILQCFFVELKIIVYLHSQKIFEFGV
jgi:hypothetical protein